MAQRKKSVRKRAPKSKRKDDASVVMDGSMTIARVQDLQERLTKALRAGTKITVDSSTLERVDTAALQLLLAFSRAAMSQSIDVEWPEPSPVLVEAITLLNLEDELKLSTA